VTDGVPNRLDAIRLVREDRMRTRELLDRVSPDAFLQTGLGGGTWSPKDLVGHLETWEQFALEAIEAIGRGEPAPITGQSLDTDDLNRREVERKAGRSAVEVSTSATAKHDRLLAALEALADNRWSAPEGEWTDRTVGDRLGSILGGSRGFFRHDPDHWDDLAAFAGGSAPG
jgi:hypothetical protein